MHRRRDALVCPDMAGDVGRKAGSATAVRWPTRPPDRGWSCGGVDGSSVGNRPGPCVNRPLGARRRRRQRRGCARRQGANQATPTPCQSRGGRLARLGGERTPHLLCRAENIGAVSVSRDELTRSWFAVLRRRIQRTRIDWDRMGRYVARWPPAGSTLHPFPIVRFDVCTQCRSPVRSQRMLGTVRPAARNRTCLARAVPTAINLGCGRTTGSVANERVMRPRFVREVTGFAEDVCHESRWVACATSAGGDWSR